jgi:hypothetical protein
MATNAFILCMVCDEFISNFTFSPKLITICLSEAASKHSFGRANCN